MLIYLRAAPVFALLTYNPSHFLFIYGQMRSFSHSVSIEQLILSFSWCVIWGIMTIICGGEVRSTLLQVDFQSS